MMNAFREKCRLIIPEDGYDSLGQPLENIRGDHFRRIEASGSEIIDIEIYISPSPGEKRVSTKRDGGFDYTTVTHYAVTSCKKIKKGAYIQKGDELWRVDYTVKAGKNDILAYLFELL